MPLTQPLLAEQAKEPHPLLTREREADIVVVREEEGERDGDVVVVRNEGETATGRLVGAEN